MRKFRTLLLSLAVILGVTIGAAPNAMATTYGWGWKSDTVYVIDKTKNGSATAQAVKNLHAQQPYLAFTSVKSCPAGANCVTFDAHAGDNSWFAHAHLGGGSSCTVSWNTTYGKKNVSSQTFVTAAMHEIGHCIGLAHPDLGDGGGLSVNGCYVGEPDSIMRRSVNCASTSLTAYDLADLASLYEGVFTKPTDSDSGGNNGGGNNGKGGGKGRNK